MTTQPNTAPADSPPPLLHLAIESSETEPPKQRKRHRRPQEHPSFWPLMGTLGVFAFAALLTLAFMTGARIGHIQMAVRTDPGTVRIHKAPAHPKPAGPVYDLAGYHYVITGPQEQAFAAALGHLRHDMKASNYVKAGTDAPALTAIAAGWLSQLEHSTPPPRYLAQKVAYIQTARTGLQAGEAIQQALTSPDPLTGLQQGAGQLGQAHSLLSHVPPPAALPTPRTTLGS